MADRATLGLRLKAIREGRQLSLVEAATWTGHTTSYLAYLEGDAFVPTERSLLRIMNAYRVDPHELLALREQARAIDDE